MPNWLKLILTNGAVVGSVINLIDVLVFYVNPNFPREIFLAVTAVINSIYAVFGVIVVFNQMQKAKRAKAALMAEQ